MILSIEKDNFIKTAASVNGTRVLFDTVTLEEKLGKEDPYINAEILLMESHRIKSQQIEDINLYNAAREKINLLDSEDPGG